MADFICCCQWGVHGVAGVWGMISVALFADKDIHSGGVISRSGLFKGGGGYLLGWQLIACLSYFTWSFGCNYILMKAASLLVDLRVRPSKPLLWQLDDLMVTIRCQKKQNAMVWIFQVNLFKMENL